MPDLAKLIEGVLGEHLPNRFYVRCCTAYGFNDKCDWRADQTRSPSTPSFEYQHRAHVAAVLAERLGPVVDRDEETYREMIRYGTETLWEVRTGEHDPPIRSSDQWYACVNDTITVIAALDALQEERTHG